MTDRTSRIDVNDSVEIFELGTPVMRVLPRISRLINHFNIPTIDWYRWKGKIPA